MFEIILYALRTYVIAVHEQTTNTGLQKNTEINKYYMCVLYNYNCPLSGYRHRTTQQYARYDV